MEQGKQEESFKDGISKSMDLFAQLREINILMEFRQLAEEKQKEMSISGLREQEYCEVKGRGDAFQEIISYCNERISKLTKKD